MLPFFFSYNWSDFVIESELPLCSLNYLDRMKLLVILMSEKLCINASEICAVRNVINSNLHGTFMIYTATSQYQVFFSLEWKS